jgi:hypothetical protein
MKAEFKAAPWGTRIWVITVFVALLLLGIIPAITLSIPILAPALRWLIIGMDASIVAISALFLVRGYVISDNVLLVRRSFWETRLDLSGLRSAVADPEALKGAWKTVGNDGLFAIHGWFRGKRLGKFRAFVTSTAHTVVLDYGEQKVVVSPDNPEGFVKALQGTFSQ